MNTKIYTPEQARLIKADEDQRKLDRTKSLRKRMHDAEERKELKKIADDLMMGWDAA